MQNVPSPLFLWVGEQMINMALCQGVRVYEDEEDGWTVSFNMLDQSIDCYQESEEEANAVLEAVYGVMQAQGLAIAFPE
jgi:hypothetical protein